MVRISTRTLPVLAVAAAIGLTANSSGPTQGGDRTGSPLGSTACGTCHNGGTYTPETAVELLDGDGVPQASYVPGETYTLRVSIAGADDAMAYGFQAVVLDTAGTTDLGTYGAASDGTQTSPFGQRMYFEHAAPLTEPVGEVEWIAPAAGAGDIVVYAAGNAVNRNGSTAGDNVDLVEVRFAEATSGGADTTATDTASAVARLLAEQWDVEWVDDLTLRVTLPDDVGGASAVEVVDLSGRRLAAAREARGAVDVALPEVRGVVVVRALTADGRSGVRKVPRAR